MGQLSHPYMTTGKTIALTRWTFVGKVTSLFFNMLSWLVITFLPRSKHLLISWLQSPSAVILEPKRIKSATVSTVSPSICHEVMGPDAMIFVFWMLSFKPTFSFRLLPKFSSFGCRAEAPCFLHGCQSANTLCSHRAPPMLPLMAPPFFKPQTVLSALKALVWLHQACSTPNNLCLPIRQHTKKVM